MISFKTYLLTQCLVYCVLFPVTKGCTLFFYVYFWWLDGSLPPLYHPSLSCVCGVFRPLECACQSGHILSTSLGRPARVSPGYLYIQGFSQPCENPCVVGGRTIAACSRSTLPCKGLVCSLAQSQSHNQPIQMKSASSFVTGSQRNQRKNITFTFYQQSIKFISLKSNAKKS